jgi:hypothetical protein
VLRHATTQAEIRISDAWDSTPVDGSNGVFTINVPTDAGDVPTVYALERAGPNPFHGQTQIRYRLPQTSRVTLDAFDLHGRRVARLVDAEQRPGSYTATFGRDVVTAAGDRIGDLAAGVYFVRLRAGTFSRTAKLVLAR